ncbi:MAG: Trehalase [Myxococcaceae bacterium]|jgi:GH15 family glucan-1,4-alpha-glucosidase|nr:Trehalase [Myxococcaceae bacterium]
MNPLASRIEDYALIGDCQSVALVSKSGSIDWLCLPRFDSEAFFAALLGSDENGMWRIAPAAEVMATTRKYADGTLVLETTFETAEGAVKLIDFMPPRGSWPDVMRIVVGLRGRVSMRMDLRFRFGYGAIVPWVRQRENVLYAIAGPDAVRLVTPIHTHGENLSTVADFTVNAGDRIPFVLTWHLSHERPPPILDAEGSLADTLQLWNLWSARCTHRGKYEPMVKRSLLTLKALTYAPTGAIAAAATTSLPEKIGGVRNWDYRFCWLRDATFTLYALLGAGFTDEAAAFREWLLRAIAGDPSQIQVLYGLAGERRLTELELPWLGGYEGSKPVRIGNMASEQLQLDVYGELMDTLHQGRRFQLEADEAGWRLQTTLMEYLEKIWGQPDEGIWEVRGPRRHFTHSKVMAWVALDRAVKTVEEFKLAGPVDRWRAVRDQIHASVCDAGYDSKLGSFVQYYGAKELDASLLLLPLVGFLPPNDPRIVGTVHAIEQNLMSDGFVQRYTPHESVDGLPKGEGAFLACSFWLADNYVLQGRHDNATELFERLLGLANDVGLLAEEWDPIARRQLGNFPQAFSHVSLVNTAKNLEAAGEGPAVQRATLPPKLTRV